MPANRVIESLYIGSRTSGIEGFNESSLYKEGELGGVIHTVDEKAYQLVQLDSGATASANSGVVAAGDLAFWKDKSQYLVTNDIAQAIGAEQASQNNKRNSVAGVFTAAVTAGYFCVVQQRGRNSAVNSDGGADFTIGDNAIAANTTASDVDRMAAGTAPTHTVVGAVAAAESGGFTALDLQLTPIP